MDESGAALRLKCGRVGGDIVLGRLGLKVRV